VTDVATQTQRLTLDVVGLTAFSHDFRQTQRVADDLAGAAGDATKVGRGQGLVAFLCLTGCVCAWVGAGVCL
jgi:hypothetical protein